MHLLGAGMVPFSLPVILRHRRRRRRRRHLLPCWTLSGVGCLHCYAIARSLCGPTT